MLTPLVITLAVPCLFALDLLSLGIVLRAPLLVQQLASLHLVRRRPRTSAQCVLGYLGYLGCAAWLPWRVAVRDGTKTKAKDGPDAVLGRIEKLCGKVLVEAQLKPSDIAGLGIGAPGAIDIENGVVLRAVNLDWDHFPLRGELRKRFPFGITVDNDVNVGAWGEYKAGAGRGHDE